MLVNLTPSVTFEIQPPERFALVDRFYRAQGYKVKCAANERIYTHASLSEGLVSAVRLVPQTSGHYWLRNLLVRDDLRGNGLAKALIKSLLPDIAPQGCYCFALPHLKRFYENAGFVHNPPDCPNDIASRFQIYQSRGRDWLLMGCR